MFDFDHNNCEDGYNNHLLDMKRKGKAVVLGYIQVSYKRGSNR